MGATRLNSTRRGRDFRSWDEARVKPAPQTSQHTGLQTLTIAVPMIARQREVLSLRLQRLLMIFSLSIFENLEE